MLQSTENRHSEPMSYWWDARNVLRTSVWTSPTVFSVLEFVMMVAFSSKLFNCSWSYRSDLSATAKLWSRLSTWQCKMPHGLCFWNRITSVFFHGRHYHRICHQLNIYGMNSVDVFVSVKTHRKKLQELRDTLVHEWNNIPQAFIQRLIGSMRWRCEAVVVARGGHIRYWTPQTSILNDNFCLSTICSDNDVEKFCWYCLICYANMKLNYTIFVDFFLYGWSDMSIRALLFQWTSTIKINLRVLV